MHQSVVINPSRQARAAGADKSGAVSLVLTAHVHISLSDMFGSSICRGHNPVVCVEHWLIVGSKLFGAALTDTGSGIHARTRAPLPRSILAHRC